MIDPDLKRSLGQMTYGVNVLACSSGGVTRAYTSTWVCQVSFEEPVLIALDHGEFDAPSFEVP